MKTIKVTALLVFMMATTACGRLDLSLNQPVISPDLISKPSTQGVEVVSGSSMGKRTVINGYYVDASVGATRDKLEQRSPSGYTIYHGVKGAIVSDSTSAQ